MLLSPSQYRALSQNSDPDASFTFGVVPYDVVDAVASNELDDYDDDDFDVDVVTFITYVRTTSY